MAIAIAPDQLLLRRVVSKQIVASLLVLLVSLTAYAGQATLAWDPSPSPGVAGYYLHYGQASGSYGQKIDVGNTTTYVVSNLEAGATYYYAATAYDSSRSESGYSNEVSTVVPAAAPTANFGATPASGQAPLSVTFTSTSSGTITGYAWNLGDGITSTTQNPTHVYSTAGVYSVSLTVTGPGGADTKAVAGLITVLASAVSPPVANFSASPASGPAPLAVTLTNSSTGSISGYAWNFGDGTGSTTQNPTHTYSTAGTYSVSLTVTGPGGTDTKSIAGLITASSIAPGPGVPGLVAAYGFDEQTGGSVTDASGNGNNGAISGATWATSGRFGSALSFNGVNSWVTVQDSGSLDLSTGMSLEAWVYPTAAMSGWRDIIMKEQPYNTVYYLCANSDNGQPVTGVFGTSEQILYGGTTLPPYAWTHLAATYDGTTQRLYVNGVQVGSRPYTGIIRASASPLRIGGDGIWGEFFQGLIDEVRIYNRALSVSEIQTDMSTPVAAP
jgi:PKD repeat protein